nr:zinc metalloproteinase-disintegrin-like batroxstatin-2 isoform X1 [Leptinotarsa decemlineata]
MGSVKRFGLYLNFCFVISRLIIVAGYSVDLEFDRRWKNSVFSNRTERTEEKSSKDFHRQTLVTATIYHGRTKRHISTTLEEKGIHTKHIEINIDVDGDALTLDLTLNKKLIPEGFFHKYQKYGISETVVPNEQQTNLCEYVGKVRGKPTSWVSVSTCEGLSGVIFDGNELHYIEKDSSRDSSKGFSHFLYSYSNLARSNASCGHGESNGDHEHLYPNEELRRHKRFANRTKVLRGPYNANEETRYVELVLVMDNGVYKNHGENIQKTVNYAKSIANIVNALYSRLNIYVALVGVVVWNEQDEIDMSSNGDRMLTNFLEYRKKQLVNLHPNDNAQFITKQIFDNGVYAKALKGPICTFEYSGGVVTDFSPVVGLIATSVAHTMGHNFGMEHDTDDCECPKDICIMSTKMGFHTTYWSSCSINYLKLAFSRGMDYCLKNKPRWLFNGPLCGNGFVEPGEQCDCGLPEYCENSCCDAETCTLRSNATCASGECCDYETCSLKKAGTLCRSAKTECDLPEYCTGYADTCPTDYHKLNAEICDGGNAYCYQGFCNSRSDQCKLLWGDTGKSSQDACYQLNIKGTRFGNCGYDKRTHSYTKCTNESVLCGMLQCQHLNERLEFGMESVAILSYSFINKGGEILACRTANIDLGLDQVDPGLTPNGAQCGIGKMCVNQKCVSVSEFRNQGQACLRDCGENGWCNNMGNCHCKDGFAPPYCTSPGPGGSTDSGPATDPGASWRRSSTATSPSVTSFAAASSSTSEHLSNTITEASTIPSTNETSL